MMDNLIAALILIIGTAVPGFIIGALILWTNL